MADKYRVVKDTKLSDSAGGINKADSSKMKEALKAAANSQLMHLKKANDILADIPRKNNQKATMRDYRISVSQFDFLRFDKVEIDKQINEHACAVVSGLIHDDVVEQYEQKLMGDTWVTVSAIGEDGESSALMSGIVSSFEMNCLPHETTLMLKIMSGTWLMDGYPHFRTFQNASKTYFDVMKTINSGYPNAGVIGIEATHNPIGDLLLQYNETDWQFIKRISSHLGAYVTPSYDMSGVKYYVGMQNRGNHTLQTGTPYRVNKQIGLFMQRSSSGIGSLNESDYLEYEVKTREIYELWDKVDIGVYAGYVCSIHSEYIGAELLHAYKLRSSQGMATIVAFSKQQAGCSFEAVVKEVTQDVVRIDVIGDENPGQTNTKWFQYSTVYSSPDGPGWYCMPEVGDHVRLHIPSEREQQGYVISAVHKEKAADRQNPDHKSIKTKWGKQLLMTPDSMVMTNNNGMKIEIRDDDGIKIISDKEIMIQAASNVTISSEEATLMIAGTDSVDIVQNGATIKLDDEIKFTGAKFRIN